MKQNNSKNFPFTPKSISEQEELGGLVFNIPLYQRLFEWGEEQIGQLLRDLYSSFKHNAEAPYYIGMLTSKTNGIFRDLVDGQQRFTAIMLLGIYFRWNEFLMIKSDNGGKARLQFSARDEDEMYLMQKIKGEPISENDSKNDKMEKGLGIIGDFMHKYEDEKDEFEKYIFNHLTFFISELPSEYDLNELNTYFERMNTTGKALENYEILEVEMLRRLDSDKELYTHLWNAASQMDKKILRLHRNEKMDALRGRYYNAIQSVLANGDLRCTIECAKQSFDEETEGEEYEEQPEINGSFPTIAEIEPSSDNPYKIIKRRSEEHAMFTFPEFLLLVLYLCVEGKTSPNPTNIFTGINITDFFDTRKLNETFLWAFEKRELDAKMFIRQLILYRLLNDYFLIRVNDEDDEPYPFELYNETETEVKNRVGMYQSMLYAASTSVTYYLWVPKIMSYLKKYVQDNHSLDLPGNIFLDKLKQIDNEWHPGDFLEKEMNINIDNELSYRNIDRYWFWRIDYYLWEQRDTIFNTKELQDAVANYVFRRNRSIEHIAPQHPNLEYQNQQGFRWDDDNDDDELKAYRDCIGNMVMISSGQNSTLSNSRFEIKRAVMKLYAEGQRNGHVESLKMLYVYSKYEDWSIDNIKEHHRFSIDFLKSTYDQKTLMWYISEIADKNHRLSK